MANNFVYHGSPERNFEIASPKQSKRFQYVDGELTKVFDELSFHATPYKWVALTYMCDHEQTFELNGKRYVYNKGVDLYGNRKELDIYGIDSLEKSLEKLYGRGGYLYTFDASDFFHMNGLGDLELITQKEVVPITIQHIGNPIEAMENNGVTFRFFDLTDPKYDKYLEERV